MRDLHPHIDYRRISILLIVIILMAVIGSLTIGRDIYESGEKNLYSFAIVNLFGYLFVFFLMPMELAFIFYLRTGYDPVMLNLVAISTALASQVVDYLIGYFFSARIIDRFIGRKRYEKAEEEIRKYGNWTLFFSNLLPLSSPIISLAAGMLKYRVKDAIMYSSVGMICRYLLLTLLFHG
ncbi:MAG TPA: VTT domain-containing protein [Prolixibacteraceae bacterium]|jgi:membrane protein YqaA with SNARE-associated domain|nr:VTT domain-containing protein [Prolixibacteraceae bacterium]HPR85646.1 VTT domain-containing protein [Prolixibacteraceae bacterium]